MTDDSSCIGYRVRLRKMQSKKDRKLLFSLLSKSEKVKAKEEVLYLIESTNNIILEKNKALNYCGR